MARATYANPKIRNQLVPGREGGWTRLWPEGEVVSFFAASEAYRSRRVPLIVLAGNDFGVGSSRDWAAKGPSLLGVRAIIARSFERIHRSNLIGLGITPLLFAAHDSVESLQLNGSEIYDLTGIAAALSAATPVKVRARQPGGKVKEFAVLIDVRSSAEIALLQRGGIFQAGLQQALLRAGAMPGI
jgi:aconitate hydratase